MSIKSFNLFEHNMITSLNRPDSPDRAYYLENIPEMHRQNPMTFDKPSQEELDTVRVGSIVKLIFCPTEKYREQIESGGERMWVKVTDIRDGKLFGTLDNDPFVFDEFLSYGDVIEFSFDNIADIYRKS